MIKEMGKELVRGLPVEVQKILFFPLWGGVNLSTIHTVNREKQAFRQYDSFTLTELEKLQYKRLKKIITYAYEHVRFYKCAWDKAGFYPELFQSFDDMNRIPVIDKSTIKNHLEELISDEVKRTDLMEHRTGGSTGIPALFYYDRAASLSSLEAVHRWRYYAGVFSPFEKSVLMFRTPGHITNDKKRWGNQGLSYKGTYDMFSNSLCLSSMNLFDEVKSGYVKKMKSLRPDYMQGYASAIGNLAKYMQEKEERLKLKAVLTSSDMLTDPMRKVIEEVFQCKVFDRYGQGEEVATAIECEQHDGYHMDMDKCYIQIVNEQGEEVFEKRGEIVGTNLVNYAMPLIRYNMHDEAALTKKLCRCKRKSWRLYDLNGRSDDVLRFRSGRIAESATLTQLVPAYVHENVLRKIVEYQFEQMDFQDIRMNLVLTDGAELTKEETGQLEDILIKCIRENVKVRVCRHSVLDRGYSGKLRFIMNHMDDERSSGAEEKHYKNAEEVV